MLKGGIVPQQLNVAGGRVEVNDFMRGFRMRRDGWRFKFRRARRYDEREHRVEWSSHFLQNKIEI
jgi:hypothetical protein